MKKFLFSLFLGALTVQLCALEESPKEEKQSADMKKVAEAFGHLIGKNLETLGCDLDTAAILKGIEDAMAGKNSPMSETDCVQAISHAQEEAFQAKADENLAKANEFMHENVTNDNIVVVEKERLHYRVDSEGTGAEVQPHYSPLITYTGRFIDGEVFGASHEEEMISLDEAIPGFSRGLVGMKEGETRTIYIHPEFGYGTSGYLPPNSLLTFEVKVIKANASHDDQESLTTTIHAKGQSDEEIALPNDHDTESLR